MLSCVLCTTAASAICAGTGGLNVYRCDRLVGGTWERIDQAVELPPETLLYAEIVNEIQGKLLMLFTFCKPGNCIHFFAVTIANF